MRNRSLEARPINDIFRMLRSMLPFRGLSACHVRVLYTQQQKLSTRFLLHTSDVAFRCHCYINIIANEVI